MSAGSVNAAAAANGPYLLGLELTVPDPAAGSPRTAGSSTPPAKT